MKDAAKEAGKTIVVNQGNPSWFALTLILILLKVMGVADISWWLVLLPMYWGFAVYLALVAVVLAAGAALLLFGAIIVMIETVQDWFRRK